jgi:hypothetical protein
MKMPADAGRRARWGNVVRIGRSPTTPLYCAAAGVTTTSRENYTAPQCQAVAYIPH